MHQSGKCHYIPTLITLFNCILTYSASFSVEDQANNMHVEQRPSDLLQQNSSVMFVNPATENSNPNSLSSNDKPANFHDKISSFTSTYPPLQLLHSTLPASIFQASTTNSSSSSNSSGNISSNSSLLNLVPAIPYTKNSMDDQIMAGAESAALVSGSAPPLPSSKQTKSSSGGGGGGESVMLNYIYDSHAPNKHKHYDFRLGPHFEGAKIGGVSNVSVQLNGTAHLNCKVSSLQDRTVSWVKRDTGSDKLQLLTVGNHTYSADHRYTVDFQQPNNWRLKISAAIATDEGTYECQISTYPPRLFRVYLTVNAPEVIIVNEFSEPLYDTFYEADSTIQLNCIVRYITMLFSVVHWTHNGRLLNDDIVRGGISVKTNLSEDGANSTLFVARVNKTDSGNYTCSIGPTHYFSTNVHVLNEESLAELYHGGACKSFQQTASATLFFLLMIVIVGTTSLHSSVR